MELSVGSGLCIGLQDVYSNLLASDRSQYSPGFGCEERTDEYHSQFCRSRVHMSQSSVSQTAANTHWGSIARERGETDEQHSHVVATESARGAVRG